MLQLDLFGGPPVDVSPASPLVPDPEPEVALDAVEGPDPDQLDLFNARAAQLRAARAAVEQEDLEGARLILAELLARGDDPEARRAMTGIMAVQARAEAARRLPAPARALELLAHAGEFADAAGLQGALCAVLHRWAARAVQLESGDGACLEGWPVGVYFVRGGDLVAARASLGAALSLTRRARTLYALGDLAAREGDAAAARDWYCEALARDPFDADAVSAILDREIAELPDIARYEMELDPHPEAWSAPLGMITGVFRIPRQALTSTGFDGAGARSSEQLEVLASVQAFIAALVAAERAVPTEPPIAARRAMKHLQPRLFAAYLERRSRVHAAGRQPPAMNARPA